jgi:hypothetical protein
MKKFTLLVAGAMLAATAAHAGGQLETVKVIGPSGIAGFDTARVIPIFWDDRCAADVKYTVDTIAPNAGGGPAISVAAMAAEMQASLDPWNDIDTSFVDMNVDQVRTIGNGLRTFDFINELTFETPAGSGFLASSPSVSFIEDVTLLPGDDIDGDGDSDVYDPGVVGQDTCFDQDMDGDIEFPAGDYAAGTMLDNDVQFNNAFAWALAPSAASTVDIKAVAVHEFGHSHGLSHSLINIISGENGTGSTMFPFIDTTDSVSETEQRTPHTDDIAWSSYVYPEGTGATGPRALQAGDTAFSSEFHVLTGEVVTEDGTPILGGNVAAIISAQFGGSHGGHDLVGFDGDATGPVRNSIIGEAFSGVANLLRRQADGALFFAPPEIALVAGDYSLPVPRGHYKLHLQATDGRPAAGGNISFTAQIGQFLGQLVFSEEFWDKKESALEPDPTKSNFARAPQDVGDNFKLIANRDIQLRNAGAINFAGTSAVFGQMDVIYAERFSNAAVLAILNGGAELTSALWDTTHQDASLNPTYQRAALVPGRLTGGGLTADLQLSNEFADANNFVGQDSDLTPLFLSKKATKKIKQALAADPTLDLFLVLEQGNNFITGDSGLPPLLALQSITPSSGQSFLSLNGGPFNVRPTQNWGVEMRFTPPN